MKKILVSIDTEGHIGENPVERLIFGKTDKGQLCGIGKIMDILDEFGIRGLFFVDIAEAWEYGEDKIASVLKYIDERGHDVGVHIHPEHMSGRKERMLWQYTKEEQLDMISRCSEFYERILGRAPISFRAGAYGCNNDTLDILMTLGYKYDMSQFYGNKNCHIEPPITSNRIVRYGSLIEVPVTSYKSFSTSWYSRYDKMDVMMKYGEFKDIATKMIMDEAIEHIDLFVHSFSLLKWKSNFNNPKFKKKMEMNLKRMISFFLDNKCEFISEKSFDDGKYRVSDNNCEVSDYSKGVAPWFYLVRRAFMVKMDHLIRKKYHKRQDK